MAKIYYSIDTTTKGYPVHWIDPYGGEHTEVIDAPLGTPGDVDMEFQITHRGAIWLKWDDFCKRLGQMREEKAKLARWNAGV